MELESIIEYFFTEKLRIHSLNNVIFFNTVKIIWFTIQQLDIEHDFVQGWQYFNKLILDLLFVEMTSMVGHLN